MIAGELLDDVAVEAKDHAIGIELAAVNVPLSEVARGLCGPVCVLVVP
jgi:hypothetical protein